MQRETAFSFSFPGPSHGMKRLRCAQGLKGLIRRAAVCASQMPREALSPAGRWIADHMRLLLDEADALERELRFAPALPAVNGEPRLLLMARQIIQADAGEITPARILRAARAVYGEEEMTEAELALMKNALACAILEALRGALEELRREHARFQLAGRWAEEMNAGKRDDLPREAALRFQVLEALEALDAEAASTQAFTTEEARQYEERQAQEGLRTGRLIRALLALPALPFDRIGERLSPAAQALRQEKTYQAMDAESRNDYRACACRIARRLGVGEGAAARAAVALAREKQGVEGQAGYYLKERPDLIAVYLMKRKKPSFALRHREGLFLLALYGGAALSPALCWLLKAPWYLFPALALCLSEGIRLALYALIRRRFPARTLPRLRLLKLREELRTLVVVPTLLTSRTQALRMVKHLAVLRQANPDPYLDYMLLADFRDSPQETEAEDESILETAKMAVDALNAREGGGYLYLHRKRTWDMGQRRFTGRERKRGALEALNHLLTEGKCRDEFLYISADGETLRNRYAYVITLDADTFLPPGAANQLIGAMEHPLQKGRVGVVQPRMAVGADTVRTRAQRLFGGPGGTDPYHLAAQDVYQDVFGKGSFVGKGIYAPAYFLRASEGRLPRGRLLSHDLIEGETVGSAFAGDIALYDGHPASAAGWLKRLHRWTRGDWQLLPFLWDRRLPLLSRHKIWDNLRRSLLPGARIALLLAGAGLSMPALWLLALPWPLRGMPLRLLALPSQAVTALDAAVRALYRQFISHQNLLSWVTAAENGGDSALPLPCALAHAALGAAMAYFSLRSGGWWPGALIGIGWLAAPLLTGFLNGDAEGKKPLTPAMEQAARALARDTWRFFEDAVSEKTLYLPPDNVQRQPEKGPALRTSPTNMGLYLLSCCAARELGFISSAEMAARLENTLNTLEQLDTWKGHFYNWYSLETGRPLPPRFISTVDSGNLAGCLLCCAQICRNHLPELPGAGWRLPERLDDLAMRMDFSAVYDAGRHLFHIGWEAEKNRPTPAHYDCLASEARLTSFIAIMTGQVERRHWRYLSRAAVRAGGGAALLSWGGTMFEYLMPHLLLPLYPGTLLGEGCRRAVRAQMAADPSRPFGVSESGYYAFDPDLNYQYRAFGLPILARSGETAGQVIAPYASVLAMPFFPQAAARNIRRMERLGWRDGHGLYEAADYSGQEGPRLVKSHMAHHQGMILCALCNALEHNALVRAFMTPAAPRANAYLLCERALGPVHRRAELPNIRPREEAWPWPLRRAQTGLPMEAHALSGHDTVWVMNAQGQGYLAHQGIMASRFRSQAGEQTGPQCYVRDPAGGAFIRPAAQGSAVFGRGEVIFSCAWQGLQVTERRCVDPLLGMAVTAVKLENPGDTEREAEILSFLEIAQSPWEADAAHPNFRDLSVRVSPWGSRGLISRRLPREENEQTPLIAHAAAGDVYALRRQGDRTLFLGRGSYAAPDQASLPAEMCEYRTGDAGAPCLSLRVKTRVPRGGEAVVYLAVLFAENEKALRDEALAVSRLRASFSLAAARASTAARHLRLDGAGVDFCQKALGALLFYDQPHQALWPAAPQNALWRFGVSGTLPVLLIDLTPGADRGLLRRVFQAHAWMRMQGVPVDLVVFCPREEGYLRPCRDQVMKLLEAGPDQGMLGKRGGVHVAEGSETDLLSLRSLSRLTLRGGQSLKAQWALLRTPWTEEKEGVWRLPQPEAFGKLRMDHSFGGFMPGFGYWIKKTPPVPWHHMLCGPAFGTLVCESGILESYAGSSRQGRITRKSPDVYVPSPSEEIILRDETGAFYPLVRCAAAYEAGAAAYRNQAGDIAAETSVFSHAERALGVRSVTLRSARAQTVTLFWIVRFALGEAPESTRCRAEENFVWAQAGDAPRMAWAALEGASCQALSSAVCFGLGGEWPPPALRGFKSGLGSVGLLRREVTLRPRESCRLTLALGAAENPEAARQDYAALLREGAADAERGIRAFWNAALSRMLLFSCDEELNALMNLWLPYQVRAARLMARMGPYQPGGAIGFRDQLQDCLALLHTQPEWVRSHLLLCAAHQFPEGDVQHWWHAPQRGVRTRISDDKLFLPFITARYVAVTGDEAVLSEEAPYLLSAPLGREEKERYESPQVSSWGESLLGHCLRAIDSVALGAHGLPLMGDGDWNDGMNRIGGRQGESVWLGFFLALTLREFAPFCPDTHKEKYTLLRRKLLDGAESAWTGKWYLRAWRDGGSPLGGPDTNPPRIDLISQCFAVLGGAPRDHAREAVIHAVNLLYDREAGIVKLLWPPFAPEENAGYIGAYLPGVRENGGQYTHAVPWLILALCRLGEYALAWEIAGAVLPSHHADTKEKALVYRTEPYVLCGDVYAGENRGRGGWSWYTGSAAWLYYAVLTELLGFEKRGNRARLRPCPGPDTREFTLVYRFDNANYHFTAARDVLFPTLDGEKLQDGWAALIADGKTHEARFPLRKPEGG